MIISSVFVFKFLKIIGILLGAWLTTWLLKHVLKAILRQLEATRPLARFRERTETIRSLFNSLISLIIWFTALGFVLLELGVNIGPLLAGAGVVGVALGFGSQTLVKDFLSGVFLVLEDQFDKGDKVEIVGVTGVVRKVGLRILILEDAEGNFHYISNSQINKVKRFKKSV